MAFFRNVQVRWMPIKGDTRLTLALERPGASGDAGVLADRIELQNVKGRFPAPDFSGEYRMGGSKGYVEVAGILRYMKWDDVLDDQFELSDSAIGWGINLSSNIKFGSRHAAPAGRVRRGHPELHERLTRRRRRCPQPRQHASRRSGARPVPITGVVAFLDHNWNSQVEHVGRLLGPVQRQHRRPDARARSGTVTTRSATSSIRRCRTRWSAWSSSGDAAELLRRLHERRHEDPGLVQVQLLREDRRLATITNEDHDLR